MTVLLVSVGILLELLLCVVARRGAGFLTVGTNVTNWLQTPTVVNMDSVTQAGAIIPINAHRTVGVANAGAGTGDAVNAVDVKGDGVREDGGS
jgi:hypothetical protein